MVGTSDTPPSTGKLKPVVLSVGDGGMEQSTQPKAVTGQSVLFSAGDRVRGLYAVKSGRPRWFAGRVKGVNKDGTLHVWYDDGDEETNKSCAEVRPNRRPSAKRVTTTSCPAAVRRVPRDHRAAGTATPSPASLCKGSESEGEIWNEAPDADSTVG